MLSLRYFPMTEDYASIIANWTYDEPYSLYSMDGDEDTIAEFMNGDYFYALDNENVLIGYICTGSSARVPGGYDIGIYGQETYLDFGLGLHPEFTGKGMGAGFVTSSLEFIRERYQTTDIQLVVAAFNERAIKVYERAGFAKGPLFRSKVGDGEVEFMAMKRSIQA
ncbi:MAG: GNAT family N-acetyltransferase [Paenibacillus dendritiformis]|uniref:GNAT family N-acetyltransferase n=1 Tax=Paenibacillus dendritiformis TaxID=130049 RepID=UPI00143D99C1|nr:GNAT family N-acetyltransferase [Paenibacillus dendritiformis]MDU5144865.1 GNAT family N-acetyltransferase [Paenibacillus dendritiformis]NKI24753.1 GNAT family N-acetyltransferase [Paenibacillus dendritiformis]NRF99190.1 GNAT family N-acetyltransferase [Paenibacillus dendritiformis]GIO75316.1 N-acetyltransferase [Paenibacillus dendritiformis]